MQNDLLKSGIYKITNVINNKVYIGQTCNNGKCNFKKRFEDHLRGLRTQNGVNTHFQRSWNKYGEENFAFEILEIIEDDNLLTEREQYWCDFYNSNDNNFGYNKRVAVDSNKGMRHTEETKKKMSESKMGIHYNEEVLEKTRGENHPNSKLNWEQVKNIRREYEENFFTYEQISHKYNVCTTTIQSVIQNKNWVDKNYVYDPEKVEKMKREKISLANSGKYIGENGPNSKLTWEQVKNIRREYEECTISYIKLAKKYNVLSTSVITKIIQNKNWVDKNYVYDREKVYNKRRQNSSISQKKNIEKNGYNSAKLTIEKVKEIRNFYKNNISTYHEIAQKYNVCLKTIMRIIQNKSWPDPEYIFIKNGKKNKNEVSNL